MFASSRAPVCPEIKGNSEAGRDMDGSGDSPGVSWIDAALSSLNSAHANSVFTSCNREVGN